MNHSRRDEFLDVVHHLTASIGPRASTSLAEAQAAAYIDGRLRRAGMRVSADPFRAPATSGMITLLLGLLGGLAALLTGWLPPAALLLALGGLLLTLLDGLIGPLPLLAPRRDSQNVIGTRASDKEPQWRLVLLAPLDTPAAAHSLIGGSRRGMVIGRCVAFGLLAILSLLLLFDPQHPVWWYAQALPAAYLLIGPLPRPAGAGRSRSAAPAQGGAGALAVLIAAVERLGARANIELWAVGLGATTTGAGGLRDLLARYPFPRDATLLVALESIDDGQLVYVTREGMLWQRPADSRLVQLAEAADRADTQIDAEPRSFNAAPSIAAPLHAGSYRALTLLTQASLERAEPSAAPGINPQTLDRATRLIVEMVRQLESA